MITFPAGITVKTKQKSPHIVYGSVAGEVIQITQQQFLEENPHLSLADFSLWKRWSDKDYWELLNRDRAEGHSHLPLREEMETQHKDLSNEDWLEQIENQEVLRTAIQTKLTEHEARRFVAHCLCGYSVDEIVSMENATQGAISQSIVNGRKKLKKYFGIA
ncbi:hypothetical protein LJC49_03440 [Ruminococcaceae bacterium OttesenSCG-928-I18]|nr:hypothetical protein [Ruminococcaceae bacterium OttesenSCG-928-I18]